MKHYYVAPIFYRPVGYAISLINQGYSKDEATRMAISRFAYYGKKNSKRNKEFDIKQFRKHVDRFINTPRAILMCKSIKHRK